MTHKVIPIPLFALDDDQIMRIANTLMEVENELYAERGQCQQSRLIVALLLAELDSRATTVYTLRDGQIYRKEQD